MKLILIMTLSMLFTGFYRDSEKIKRMVAIDSKNGELKEFKKLLSHLKNHKPITTETKNRKNRILNNVNQLYNKYFDTYRKNYDSEYLNERNEKIFDPNQFKRLGKKKQKSEWTGEKTERKMQKLIRFKINKNNLKKKLREICKNHYGLK